MKNKIYCQKLVQNGRELVVEDMSIDTQNILKLIMSEFKWFSIVCDESTDITDAAQVFIFVRGTVLNFNVTDELLCLPPMKNTFKGSDINGEKH